MLDTIPEISLFTGLEPQHVEILQELFEPVHYPAGAPIIAQGDIASHLYLIIKGVAGIHYKPYDGPSLLLTRIHSGDAFGWSAMMGSRFYTSTIISETDLEAIRIKRSQVLDLIHGYPEIGAKVLDRLARSVSPRWKNAHEQVETLLHS